MGFVRNEDRETVFGIEVQLQLHFDTILTAFHREAIAFMMPLETQWDDISWWYASCPLWLVARRFFNDHRIQFNALRVNNKAHTTYPKVNNWTIPQQWMMPALKMPEIQEIDFNSRHISSDWLGDGKPKKRQGPYAPPVSMYDPCHPFFRNKRTSDRFLHDGSVFECDRRGASNYTDEYLHYRREQEYVWFAKKLAKEQDQRVKDLEQQVTLLQNQVLMLVGKDVGDLGDDGADAEQENHMEIAMRNSGMDTKDEL